MFVYAELSVFEVGYVELGDAVLVAVFYKEIVLVGDINLVGNVLYFFGIVVYDCIVGLEKVESGVVSVVTSEKHYFFKGIVPVHIGKYGLLKGNPGFVLVEEYCPILPDGLSLKIALVHG